MPRVMIVEDDLTILSNLSQLLQLSGLDVVEAHDGQEALRLLLDCRVHDAALPRMIVSDLMMPNMDGFDLLRAVRGDSYFKTLPFVLLSARSDASDLQQAFALGANDYLVKPFEVEQLMDVIRYHLSQAMGRKDDPATGKDCMADTDFFLE
jgi:DNA-binding response OmpR family regulator